jgi:hypothetical protein
MERVTRIKARRWKHANEHVGLKLRHAIDEWLAHTDLELQKQTRLKRIHASMSVYSTSHLGDI